MIHESQLPPILGVPEMCQLLGMSRTTLYEARKRRKNWRFPEMPALDRKPRWSRDAVLSIINGKAVR